MRETDPARWAKLVFACRAGKRWPTESLVAISRLRQRSLERRCRPRRPDRQSRDLARSDHGVSSRYFWDNQRVFTGHSPELLPHKQQSPDSSYANHGSYYANICDVHPVTYVQNCTRLPWSANAYILRVVARFAVPISAVSGKAPKLKATRDPELQRIYSTMAQGAHRNAFDSLDPERYWPKRGNRPFWDAWLRAREKEANDPRPHIKAALAAWFDGCTKFAAYMSK